MKIRVIHIILICILIILIPVFIFVYNLYKQNTLNLSNKSNEEINDIDEFNNIDFEEDIGIATLLKYYNNRIYGKVKSWYDRCGQHCQQRSSPRLRKMQ